MAERAMSLKSKRGATTARNLSRSWDCADLYDGLLTIANTWLTVSFTAAIGSPAAALAAGVVLRAAATMAAAITVLSIILFVPGGRPGIARIADARRIFKSIASFLLTLLLATRTDVVDQLPDCIFQHEGGFGLTDSSTVG